MKPELKKKITNRLHITQGQIRGLEKMVKEEKYCPDILIQCLAVQRSLQSFNRLMLENHLREHVSHQMKNRNEARAIKELLKIYKLIHY